MGGSERLSDGLDGMPTEADALAEPKDFGKRGFLTPEQQKTADEFMDICDKEALEMARYSAEDPRDTVCRYLRSRKFLLDPALKLLNACKSTKLEGKAKEYAKMKPEEAGDVNIDLMKTFYPHTMKYHDKENRPILWDGTGRIKTEAIMCMMTRELLLGYHFWTMENLLDEAFGNCATLPPFSVSGTSAIDPPDIPAEKTTLESSEENNANSFPDNGVEGEMFNDKNSETDGEDSTKFSPYPISTLCVMDLEGFGIAQCGQKTMDQVGLYIKTDNICYPETLGKMLIINAPWIINKVWAIVKGWLDPRTVAKIEILGGDKGLKRLRELVSNDQLPKDYGGDAPGLYNPLPHAEYQLLPRGGEYSYEVTVPSNCSIAIDTYFSDIDIEYTVESRKHPSNGVESSSEKARKEEKNSNSGGWFNKKVDPDAPPTFSSLAYRTTKSHAAKLRLEIGEIGRRRHLHNLSASELESEGGAVQVQVTWKNTARMTRYPIVFGITFSEG